MSGLALIEDPKIEEVPRFFKFEKQHFTSQHPSYANLNYDPFPDNKYDDVVRTEIFGRELVIWAKLKGPIDSLKIGMSVNFNDRQFALQEIKERMNEATNESLYEIVGTASIAGEAPLEILKRLRGIMAASNAQT